MNDAAMSRAPLSNSSRLACITLLAFSTICTFSGTE